MLTRNLVEAPFKALFTVLYLAVTFMSWFVVGFILTGILQSAGRRR